MRKGHLTPAMRGWAIALCMSDPGSFDAFVSRSSAPYIRTRPNAETEYVELIGVEGARALASRADAMPRRVPLAKAWLTAMLDWQGHSVPEIARKLRVSDVSVRRMLKGRNR